MSIHVALNHQSIYKYKHPVSHHPHLIRLRPAPHCRTRVLSYSLRLSSKDHFLNWQQDPFGNYLARGVFPTPLSELKVEVDLVAEMVVLNPFDFFIETSAEKFPFSYEKWLKKELSPYMKQEPRGPAFLNYAKTIPRKSKKTIDFLVDLNQQLSRDIRYLIRLEPGVQSPEETLKKGSGSCRDTAWLLVQLLRWLGLAARFTSGYLIQLKPDVKSLDGPSGTDHDFTDLHAWCEVYIPGAGWIGLDPTSGLLAGEGHIPLACTPEPGGAAPITGSTGVCEVEFEHHMEVRRIKEIPRVTLPYSEETWSEINALGETLDEKLDRSDVRLTMGGEPTFVSIDDMDGEEWNFTALSPNKLKLAKDLSWKLKSQLAPGGLMHHGQGKWYPGEPLPRWALSCIWRKDGIPVWKDESLFAWNQDSLDTGSEEAKQFIATLAEQLRLGEETIMPAHEDVWYYLWREQRLPENVDPLDSKLTDKVERQRLARIFESGLDETVGYALPLRKHPETLEWETGKWHLRRKHLYLIPGDSPMGLRLPMDSLPWLQPSKEPRVIPPDPFSFHDLHQRETTPGDPLSQHALSSEKLKKKDAEKSHFVRTALCVEPRGGVLHVFMPPVPTAEDYFELISLVESTAKVTGIPVTIEGETPPFHPNISEIKITPDPGVIEVNVTPSASWPELRKMTSLVYEQARLARLGTEKFLIDGRHTGTGGGNHITMGSSVPSDSPFIRRPDLLKSLVTFWQHHPSLSFLFSGMFIGPTSQHPRVDEARNDSLYELEIANSLVSEATQLAPWQIDRIYRNLLVDITGNTHRAEFCIDKMYDPDSSTGRLGLLEMRAFEMPPHPRMSLVQQLLLRAIISRLWEDPYEGKLVRWGTQIHDRFMLPLFNRLDFEDVVKDLQDHGIGIKSEWFDPHFEFRFPKHGEIVQRGLHVELRHALEPWHVLGEQGSSSGTSRYVDSSVERLQVKVSGMTESRFSVLCNHVPIPLHPTGTKGEVVAGVRYRAWQPPECLHPTIGVHAPLTFDIVDTWNGRSIGGCQYHVGDPSGRNPTTFPVNAYEAESRRLARFIREGHTGGDIQSHPIEANRDFPMTLDLRMV